MHDSVGCVCVASRYAGRGISVSRLLVPPNPPTPSQPTQPSPGAPATGLDALSARVLAEGTASPAFAQLHDRLSPGLLKHFAGKLGGASTLGGNTAEELAQMAWVMLWQALVAGQYDPSKARLTTFLYAVANTVWLRAGRSQMRLNQRLTVSLGGTGEGYTPGLKAADLTDESPQAASPAELASTAAMIELVRGILAGTISTGGLAASERAMLYRVAHGATDRDLGAELGVSPSTAHARKRAALEKLAAILTRGEQTGPT